MKAKHLCPFCSTTLLSHIRSGELYWYCLRCNQEIPYGVYTNVNNLQDSNHLKKNEIERKLIQEHNIYDYSLNRENCFDASFQNNIKHLASSLRQALQADRVLICRFGQMGELDILAESLSRGYKSIGKTKIKHFLSQEEIEEFRQGKVHIIEDYSSINHSTSSSVILERLFQVRAKLVLPIRCQHSNKDNQSFKLWGLILVHQCNHQRKWEQSEINFCNLLAEQLGIIIRQYELYQQLHSLVYADDLTQLPNRRNFERYFWQKWQKLAQNQEYLSLLIIELDCFANCQFIQEQKLKESCLENIASYLNSIITYPESLVARYQEQDFAVLIPYVKPEDLSQLENKIKVQLLQLRLPINSLFSNCFSFTIGSYSLKASQENYPESLLKAAQEQLRRAKTNTVITKEIQEATKVKASKFETNTKNPLVTNQELLMSYVAYFLARGKKIVDPRLGLISFTGSVYQYQGYHQNFKSFWHTLKRHINFKNLYLEGDNHSFREFLDGSYAIEKCARCQLPIPTPSGAAYNLPECTLCEHQDRFHQTTRILVLGVPLKHSISLQKLFNLNGLEADFCSNPETISQEFLDQPIDLILISGNLSQDSVETWAKQLRQKPELKSIPILSFSAKAGNGIPWLDQELGIEDFVLTPLNGEELVSNLQQIQQEDASWQKSEVNWFPK